MGNFTESFVRSIECFGHSSEPFALRSRPRQCGDPGSGELDVEAAQWALELGDLKLDRDEFSGNRTTISGENDIRILCTRWSFKEMESVVGS